MGKVHANIVLIGDPKQLDAVTKSDRATELGFKTSWFEQLFNQPLYKRHAATGQFNQTFITQLVQNYRSHPEILRIPNELFYENSLKAVTSPGESVHSVQIHTMHKTNNLLHYRTYFIGCAGIVTLKEEIPHYIQVCAGLLSKTRRRYKVILGQICKPRAFS